ncbi:MAG: hypothetical protein WC917_00420 [Bacilli bacterium]|jgi:tRNA nucleotidyltransferase/poly(A) polymerase
MHCPKCQEDKDVLDFSKNKARKNGLNAYCKECKNLLMRKWRASHYEEVKMQWQKWEKMHPKSASAHMKISRKIKKGNLIKPHVCTKCGEESKLIAHHPYYNYDNPLDVIWLCNTCHIYAHQEELNNKTEVLNG